MSRAIAIALCVAGLSVSAEAAEQPLICFGNEPSWGVDLTEPGVARFSSPDGQSAAYRGAAVAHDFLPETLWRGAQTDGRVLVAWLQHSACSDGMSDATHPVTARVSLPDGRFLAGCCRAAATGATAPTAVEGATWSLAAHPASELHGLARLSRPVTVRFEAGRLQGFSGCNSFTGSYQLDGDRLKLGQAASTMMACSDPAGSVEKAFQAAFSGTLRYTVEGDRLLVTAASGETLEFARQPAPALAGSTWKVTGYNNNRQAVVGPLADSVITLSFEDGQVSGSAGCNSFHGAYATRDDRIEFGPLATTRRACDEPLMAQESAFLAALASAVTWRIDGNVLDLHRADSERAIWAIKD
jgi:heat shock protein HslJ